jgi:transcriptional regulator of arginine metabolism
VSKTFRHEQIRKLLRARPLRSQAELALALHRAGVETTQVTLSRDLKELGLVKTPAGYVGLGGVEAVAPAGETGAGTTAAISHSEHILAEFVRDLRRAGNLLVVKTAAGAAATVGAALDAAGWPELAGSLAGDDTVLVICEDARRRGLVERRLREALARKG